MVKLAIRVGIGLSVLGLSLWSFWIEPSGLSQEKHQVQMRGWPQSLDGLEVAVIADLHIGSPYYGMDRLIEVVDVTNRMNPDLILLAGDYVITRMVGGQRVNPEPIAKELGRLRARHGVFAVLGNHDWWFDANRIRQSLLSAGIPVLEDRAVELKSDAHPVWLVGISDYSEGRHDIEKAFKDVPDTARAIVLTHNPDIFPDLSEKAIITFAGHTHGGQVNLPIVGPPITMSKYGQRFAVGHIQENDQHLIVSPGLGTSILPIRFRSPPTILLVTLRSTTTLSESDP